MLRSLPKHLWENYGMHSERGKESVAQIVRLYAGHDLNHLAQIEKMAKQSGSLRTARFCNIIVDAQRFVQKPLLPRRV